jgi:hypothetical protein
VIIKALSLTQPWASLVVIGAKRIETRSWPTSYRGPVAIHASKGFPRDCRALCFEEPFRSALEEAGCRPIALPRGQILGVAYLGDCQHTADLRSLVIGRREFQFGDYSPGRFGFLLSNAVKFPKPIACDGALKLWNWQVNTELVDLIPQKGPK